MRSLFTATATALLLAACGGGEGVEDPVDRLAVASAEHASYTEDAAPGENNAQPADRSAHTLAGLYVSGETAARLQRELGARVLVVDTRPGGDEQLMEDVGLTLLEQAARDLPNDVTVLVRGPDLQRASELVDRLGFAGLTHVLLVTS